MAELPTAEGRGKSLGEAKWAAVRELRRAYAGASAELVDFEVLAGPESGEAYVRAQLDVERWRENQTIEAAPQLSGGNTEDLDARDRAVEFADRIAKAIGVDVDISVEEDDEEIVVNLTSEDEEGLGLLIGKRGRTIDAIQHLLLHIIFGDGPRRKRVVVDAEGYRERRQQSLERAAERAVSEAKRYRREVQMEPMSAAERRIVHTYISEIDGVETHSEGSEPHRCLVVTPERM